MRGQLQALGPATFGSTITVTTSATIGTTLTVGTSVVASSFCFKDSSCIYAWPNGTIPPPPLSPPLSTVSMMIEDMEVFSQNVSLESGSEKVLYIGSFSTADKNELYAELTPVEDVDDESFGIVDYNFIFAVRNKAAGASDIIWNGGVVENGGVWVRLKRYDHGALFNFICTIKKPINM